MRQLRRLLTAVALSAAAVMAVGAPAQAATNHAVVVVEGSSYVISFDGTISGLQALEQAVNGNVSTHGFGEGIAVCAINGKGNSADSNCLIGPNGEYWAYYRAAPGATGWSYSGAGAGNTTVTDGSVEGWRYGFGGSGGAPPFVSYCSAVSCPPPTNPPATSGNGAAGESSAAGTAGGTTGTTAPDSTSSGSANDGTTTTSTTITATGTHRGGGQALVLHPADQDSGSPVGLAVAGAGVAGLGAGGVWIRRRRLRLSKHHP